ncbi:MAG: AarF/UbiB family protein [Oligoflexia bacterium]|nr:AarF/UbiB family protein [Oligoflexia bacterium]
MQLIKRSRQLGQAVKNVGRLRQILGVAAKYGFVDIVRRMDLGKFLPNRFVDEVNEEEHLSPAQRLRLAFEELGPTFVKFGQLLSTRQDLLPESFIEEFVKLQDNVQPLPFEAIRAVLESELGRPIAEAYASFNEAPLAAASISQVHEAVLPTGERVVVKVQRPEIEKIIDMDVSLLAFLAGLFERYIPETRIVGPKTIVDEFFRTLSYELDFVVEANNMGKMTENMRSFPEIVIPKVHKKLSTHRVLTLERLDGVPLNNIQAIDKAGIDRKKLVDVGARAFFQSVMIDGLFHGDLHGGNLFALPDNRLGIIDFGIVGRLSQKSRDQLAIMLMALVTEDYETLCYEYTDLGGGSAALDFDSFQRDVRNALSPHIGLALSELNVGKVLIDATRIATKYDIKVPGDWMIVFKAILTIEGMGSTLDPDFDLLSVSEELVQTLVKNQYSTQRISKDLMLLAKDTTALLQVLPRQLRWMFRKLSQNDFAFEIRSPDLRDLRLQLETSSKRVTYSLLAAGAIVAASISLQDHEGPTIFGYPAPATLLALAAAAFLGRLLFM